MSFNSRPPSQDKKANGSGVLTAPPLPRADGPSCPSTHTPVLGRRVSEVQSDGGLRGADALRRSESSLPSPSATGAPELLALPFSSASETVSRNSNNHLPDGDLLSAIFQFPSILPLIQPSLSRSLPAGFVTFSIAFFFLLRPCIRFVPPCRLHCAHFPCWPHAQ